MEGKVRRGRGQCAFFRRNGKRRLENGRRRNTRSTSSYYSVSGTVTYFRSDGEGRLENRSEKKRITSSSSSVWVAMKYSFKGNGLSYSVSQTDDGPASNESVATSSPHSPSTGGTSSPLIEWVHPRLHRRCIPSIAAPPSSLLSFGCFRLLLLVCFLGGAAQAMSTDGYQVDNGGGGTSTKETRITCYTCVNVSNNDECNRFAIDRPCPEGGDYCLTLHVMDAVDRERSVLVNKRCASLDDCIGDATGCNTAYGQTQCVSCCDQPYCNDSVPNNSTNAVFYRSAASAVVAEKRPWDVALRVATVLVLSVLKGLLLGEYS